MATIQTYEIESRKLRTVVAIPWAEPAAIVAVPYPAYLEVKTLGRRALKRLLIQTELNFYPAPQVESGYFPGSALSTAIRSEYDVALQAVPELNTYPKTPGIIDAFIGAQPQTPSTKKAPKFVLQNVFDLYKDPADTTIDATDLPPSWMRKDANLIKAEIKLREVPELDKFPDPPPPSFSYHNFIGAQSLITNHVADRERNFETFEVTVKTTPIADNLLTSWIVLGANRIKFDVKLQTLGELNTSPLTIPIVLTDGYYPGSTLATSNRTKINVKLQNLPELNVFSQTPVVQPPYPSFLEPKYFVRHGQRKLQSLPELNQYAITDPALYSGFYPGSNLAEAVKSGFKVKLQSLPELDRYNPPVSLNQPFTAFLEAPYFVRQEKRKALILPELNSYPATVAGYYSGFYPGSSIATAIKSSFTVKLQDLPELNRFKHTVIGPGFGVGSVITNHGAGEIGLLANEGIGQIGEIVLGFGTSSVITEQGIGKIGFIRNIGIGEEGDI